MAGYTFATGLRAALVLAMMAGTALAEEAAVPASEPVLPSIVVTKATERPIVDRVIATGSIRALEDVDVQPLVDGLSIRSLAVDIGDRVAQDQTMAILNNDALLLQKSQNEASLAKARSALAQSRAQLIEAQANADEAKRVAARNAGLKASGTVSTAVADQSAASAAVAVARVTSAEQAIEVAQSDIKVAEAQISDVDLRLSRTTIKAPVAGIVVARDAKVGAIAAGSGQPLFRLIRDGTVEMRADVTESDLLKVAVGQKARLRLADSRLELQGTVRLVAPMVDADTRLGTVYISLTDPDRARVGMYASADIIVTEKQAIALPLTAVTSGTKETIVRKVEDGVVRMVTVTTGIQDGGAVEITSGLKAGDVVVAKAGAYVRDGDRIKPVAAPESATN